MTDRTFEQALRECAATERASGFDRVKAESEIAAVLSRLGMKDARSGILPSAAPGVVAISHPGFDVSETDIRIGMRDSGAPVAGIFLNSWPTDDGSRGIAVSFDIPGLSPKWRNGPSVPGTRPISMHTDEELRTTELQLRQARFVLRSLDVERPGAGYGKLAANCGAAADTYMEYRHARERDATPREEPAPEDAPTPSM
jgi:hypothetical protein